MHFTCTLVQEVGEQTAHDSLMTDDQHVALSLQLHDNWLQPLNQVLVGLKRQERLIKSNITELGFVPFDSVFLEKIILLFIIFKKKKHTGKSVIREGSNITLEDREGFYLSPRVAVMVLVLVPHGKFLWVCFLNRLIRHFFTHSLKHKVIKTLKT